MEINPSVRIDKGIMDINGTCEGAGSRTTIGGGISTRNGLMSFNFSNVKKDWITKDVKISENKYHETKLVKGNSRSGSLSFSTPIFASAIQIPMYTQSYNLDFSYGSSNFGFDPMYGFTGWYTLTKPRSTRIPSNAYGYLNEHLKTQENVLLDISREKDAPLHRKSKVLAVPLHTYDVFSVSGEGMNGQFRAYRSDVGILHDKKIASGSHSAGLGVELAGGSIAHLGANLNATLHKSESYKWKNFNELGFKADFKASNGILDYEPSYFKMITEQAGVDMDFRDNLLRCDYILSPKLEGGFPLVNLKSEFSKYNFDFDYMVPGNVSQSMHRTYRDRRSTHIGYFTNAEKQRMGTGHWIFSNPRNSWVCFNDGFNNQPLCWPAIPPISKPANQIGEFVITKPDGQIYTYGIPVYNNIQKDVSFAVSNQSYPADGRVTYSNKDNSLENDKGLDNFYSSQITPGYAHSFLLTSITSPDYSDRLNDGPSNDDMGKWVKFNYTRGNPNYKWRIPFKPMTANYNEGLHADPLDDKASYIYGEKELWNVHSIESRNYIAILL
ncbi:MAG: hypothetical protein IPK10_05405 [Bacteroidetes bacterium]|nr:hypothetical protein [Bacteroidota bacterium]